MRRWVRRIDEWQAVNPGISPPPLSDYRRHWLCRVLLPDHVPMVSVVRASGSRRGTRHHTVRFPCLGCPCSPRARLSQTSCPAMVHGIASSRRCERARADFRLVGSLPHARLDSGPWHLPRIHTGLTLCCRSLASHAHCEQNQKGSTQPDRWTLAQTAAARLPVQRHLRRSFA